MKNLIRRRSLRAFFAAGFAFFFMLSVGLGVVLHFSEIPAEQAFRADLEQKFQP